MDRWVGTGWETAKVATGTSDQGCLGGTMKSAGLNHKLMVMEGMCIQSGKLPVGLGSQGSGECVEYMKRQED
ncbi:rCG63217 [Rattus norvegicus]|uniref:RCG63217 n=1 Tax=Rattus norvegicus TaxID=10116 RepID=A6JQS6_RAT|nr:rCG63217 [Rattus norvegicus]